LIKLYIEYKQIPFKLYRFFNCDVQYIYQTLKEENIRWCLKCNTLKTYNDFYKNPKKDNDGYKNECKSCTKELVKKYNNHNREKKNNWNKN
jgi:hypothetical protein